MWHARRGIKNSPVWWKNAITAYCTAAGNRVFSPIFPCNVWNQVMSPGFSFCSKAAQFVKSCKCLWSPPRQLPYRKRLLWYAKLLLTLCLLTRNLFLMPDCSTRAVFVAVPSSKITKITMSTHTQCHNHSTMCVSCGKRLFLVDSCQGCFGYGVWIVCQNNPISCHRGVPRRVLALPQGDELGQTPRD